MLISIFLALIMLMPIFSFMLFMFCSKHLTWSKWVKITTAVLIFLVFVLTVIVIPVTYTGLRNEVQNTATISITEIEEIYESGQNSTYFVKVKGSDKLQAVTGTVGKGNTNYIVKTEYTKLTDKLKFWLSVEKTSYTIVVTNPNVIQKVPEIK